MVLLKLDESSLGMVILIFSLFCLGTWPALLRLCSFQMGGAIEDNSSNIIHDQRDHNNEFTSRRASLDNSLIYYHTNQYGDRYQLPPFTTTYRNYTSVFSNNSSCDCCCSTMWGCTNSFYQIQKMRNICHVYMDYSTAYCFVSCFPYIVANMISSHSNETTNVLNLQLILTACIGGTLLSLGNLSMQWATTVYRAPLTTVLALQASLTVVLGTVVNYKIEPTMTARPFLLFIGVIVFLMAITLATFAQIKYTKKPKLPPSQIQLQHIQQQQTDDGNTTTTSEGHIHSSTNNVDVREENNSTPALVINYGSQLQISNTKDMLADRLCTTSEIIGTLPSHDDNTTHCSMLDEMTIDGHLSDNMRTTTTPIGVSTTLGGTMYFRTSHVSISNREISIWKTWVYKNAGILIAAFGGICFGFFSPAFNIAVNDPFHWSITSTNKDNNRSDNNDDIDDKFTDENIYNDDMEQEESRHTRHVLDVAKVNIWFSLAFWIASFIGNLVLLQRQHYIRNNENESTIKLLVTYIKQDQFLERQLAIAAGVICALGNVLQFQAGQMVGYATADLVQAYPLVSTLWDIVLFGEFRTVKCDSVLFLLISMYVSYLFGIVLVAASSFE